MKNTIKQFVAALMLFMALPFISNAEVRNSLTIKNNTEDEIKVVICWKHKGAEGWTTSGCYAVKPYAEFRTDLNDLSLDDNIMYVHAKSDKKTWGGNAEFRIGNSPFEISHADNINGDVKTAKFKSVKVGQGNTMFFINP